MSVPAEALQTEALRWAGRLGYEVETLTKRELELFDRSFERQLVLAFKEREIVDVFLRHKAEILLGAMIAKKQMSTTFDGELPDSGKFGMVVTRAAFFGIGDDWEDAAPFSTGAPTNWIHSGTTLLGGTAGNPIRVEKNAVHVIVGVGSLHPSPKIESLKFKIDGKEKPVMVTGWPLKESGLAIKEFNNAFVFGEGKTILAQVFISGAYGASVDDYPYLLGVSFIKEEALRLLDAADVVKPAAKVVSTT